jgi:hypothetical protein
MFYVLCQKKSLEESFLAARPSHKEGIRRHLPTYALQQLSKTFLKSHPRGVLSFKKRYYERYYVRYICHFVHIFNRITNNHPSGTNWTQDDGRSTMK